MAAYRSAPGHFQRSLDYRGRYCWDDLVCASVDVEKILGRFPRGAQAVLVAYGLDGFNEAVLTVRRYGWMPGDPVELVKRHIRGFKDELQKAGYLRRELKTKLPLVA